MTIIDISGPIEDGMWSYGDPYPTPRIEQIPPPAWLDYPVYSQVVHMPVQTATYLETAAHMDRSALTIDEVPLERCYNIDAVCLWIPRNAGQAIDVSDLETVCQEADLNIQPRDAIVVGTGWDKAWRTPHFITNPPYFTAAAIDWILGKDCSLLGADTPRCDSPNHPQNFFPKFFSYDILLLAPLCNLDRVGSRRGRLISLPLKIRDACASPVRALWIND